MSRIQENNVNKITPLINGNWDNIFINQADIASWITMFTMVLESADRGTSSIGKDERHSFAKSGVTPENWSIWVGNFSGVANQRGWWHRGLALRNHEPVRNYNSQITIAAFEKLLFLSFSSSTKDTSKFSLVPWFNMRQIWPIQNNPIIKPAASLNDPEFDRLMELSSEIAYKIPGK